jgi:UPF0271 protein
MVREGAIISENGKKIPTRIDTICLHGDTPEAVGIGQTVRKTLTEAGVTVRKL